jgi:hypothetical protein
MYYFQCYFFYKFSYSNTFLFPIHTENVYSKSGKYFMWCLQKTDKNWTRKVCWRVFGKWLKLPWFNNWIPRTTFRSRFNTRQLRVARQERADFLQQRNAVIDQQNQIEDACQKDKENEAAKIFKNSRQSRSAGYTNCAAVDVPAAAAMTVIMRKRHQRRQKQMCLWNWNPLKTLPI